MHKCDNCRKPADKWYAVAVCGEPDFVCERCYREWRPWATEAHLERDYVEDIDAAIAEVMERYWMEQN